MTFHTLNDARAVEYRRQDMLRAARMQHLIREAQSDTGRLHERFLALVGDLMVENGMRLKARYEAHAEAQAEHDPASPTYAAELLRL